MEASIALSEERIIEETEKKCAPILAQARAVKIGDDASLELARQLVLNIRGLIKEVGESFDPIVRKAHEVHKEATEQRKKHLAPLEEAKKTVESTMGRYVALVQEQARIEEEKRQQEKEKRIAAEVKRLEKHMEGYADIEAQVVELEKRLSDGGLTEEDAEATHKLLVALKQKLAAKGETVDRAQMRVEDAQVAPVVTTAPSLKGVGGGRTERIPTIVNKLAVIQQIAEGKLPFDLVEINEGKLKKYVNNYPSVVISGVSIQARPIVRVR